jgi:histone-lysine N-methyltransferase SETMAR
VILVAVMPRGDTVNSAACIRTLKELGKRFKLVRPYKNPAEIFLQHDSARPHASLKTREAITKFGSTVLPLPPCSPDLAPSDLHLFGALKDAICGMKLDTDDVIRAVRTWLHEQDKAYTYLFPVG